MQDLFTSIDNYLAQEGHYAFRVRLDASHPVFRGHFPGTRCCRESARCNSYGNA